MISMLLARGADYGIRDSTGNSVLHYAASGNAIQLADYPDYVEEYYSRYHTVDVANPSGVTPIHLAHSVPMAKLLLSRGAKILGRDHQGRTPLHYRVNTRTWHWKDNSFEADSSDYIDLLKYYIKAGADLNAADSQGATPLHLAAAVSNDVGVKWLLGHGANLNARNQAGRDALHFLAGPFYNIWLQYNICWDGGEIEETNAEERVIEESRSIEMAKFLLSKSLSKTITDSDGKTPYDLALENGWDRLAKVLKP